MEMICKNSKFLVSEKKNNIFMVTEYFKTLRV